MTLAGQIPVLSLAAGDDLPQALGDSFARFGFTIVTDHGIEAPLIQGAMEATRALFALPDAAKRRYHQPGTGGARGHTPFGVEAAKDATNADLKEFWHIGRELPAGHPYRAVMADNVWPAENPAFRPIMLAFYAAFEKAGARLLSDIARYLDLPGDFFVDPIRDGNSVLRLLHYPPLAPQATGMRAAAHEDINVITLLLGAEEAGLEILRRDGTWLAIDPPAGALVVNVGDMLQRLTNHVLPSTTHRVANPAPDRRHQPRYSTPFFLHFRPDYEIAPLPGLSGAGSPSSPAPPITADAFLKQRLREIRLL